MDGLVKGLSLVWLFSHQAWLIFQISGKQSDGATSYAPHLSNQNAHPPARDRGPNEKDVLALWQLISTRFPRLLRGGASGARAAAGFLPAIEAWEPKVAAFSDGDLHRQSLSLRYRAKSGEPLRKMLPEGFALVREAARRKLAMRHFDVQMIGGALLLLGNVVEMQTGEGKTLTATLPLYLQALSGRGAHLATANDYLAERDANMMRPVYQTLGLTVGVVTANMQPPDRRKAYAADITYGTAKEMGFDFLRDRIQMRQQNEGGRDMLGAMLGNGGSQKSELLMRGLHYGLIDEADSILIDEARTPLIISTPPGAQENAVVEGCRWGAAVANRFEEDHHYDYDPDTRKVELTASGRELVRALRKPGEIDGLTTVDLYEIVERAVKVARDFTLDQQYVIRDGEVVIVDEFTGRLGEGRKWRDGIHQAIEAKEGIEISPPTRQAARVTVQELFTRYERLAGMTGTAASAAGELRRVYRLPMAIVPTRKPNRRTRLPDAVYALGEERWQAIVEEVRTLHQQGRPVLIGTRSIDKSEYLSKRMQAAGIPHEVLNAKNPKTEAVVIAEAGQSGRVTIATNMAGRGTDIVLGAGVADLGGLHVIASEMHESARIDRQLAGRAGRQGDPGSFRQFLSLEDELLVTAYGEARVQKWRKNAAGNLARYAKLFRTAQRRIERRHSRDRRKLLYFTQQRAKMLRELGQDPYLDAPD